MRDATFSLTIMPSLNREMFSVSVDVWNTRRRDGTNASGRLVNFSVERRGSRALPQSSWHVHRCCRQSAFAVDNLTAES